MVLSGNHTREDELDFWQSNRNSWPQLCDHKQQDLQPHNRTQISQYLFSWKPLKSKTALQIPRQLFEVTCKEWNHPRGTAPLHARCCVKSNGHGPVFINAREIEITWTFQVHLHHMILPKGSQRWFWILWIYHHSMVAKESNHEPSIFHSVMGNGRYCSDS